jgi:predicted 3-demethylubiquinone-9 3-methyltransferase (glyoxalase superfamily)
MPKITPNVLFETEALVAAEFYVGLFPNSKIGNVSYCGEAGPLPVGTALAVDFVLDGEDFTSINCGVAFTFSESFSLRIVCHGQEEVDHYWNALTAGGSEGRCGWLKDCFGVSWQVTPVEMGRYLGHEDPAKSSLAMQAMMKMSKIDLSVFEEAIR